ncbi:uncharacterized protein LOC100892055 [Strongylocentrotus purpuratus]|uniref:Fibronectin type-III domain-containing protein n=1 Tax=Strongylocentrotus purpuratus TaxID=7668 RepID=A0A7M7GGK6_STRPU|nr:uncharacterized protein LOC100892055 [Strongylocentrotus purpuratus]XP_011668805.1 uncharacterized protein LOC100892055 [Strongylocentrotus purpuratus]|eukprot:XP_003725324.1 PREDICTED: uncharacterized protein LOC100892055 [Strongylocentrotus purpuratus]
MASILTTTPRFLQLGLLILLGLAPSMSAISTSNFTVSDVTTTSATFSWLIVGLDKENQTDLLRNYITLSNTLNFAAGTSCLNVDATSITFDNIQPYTTYTACVEVIRLENADDKCNDDSVVVSQDKDQCASLTTEFAMWSLPNIAALGCAGGIVLVFVLSFAVNAALRKPTLNETVDKTKMRDWSKKKRTESVRDFLAYVDLDREP